MQFWLRANLPFLLTTQGNEVLVWLLKNKTNPKPLKDLYGSCRASEPTLRVSVKSFVSMGYAEIFCPEGDSRSRYVRMTPKLEFKISEYQNMLLDCAELAERGDSLLGNPDACLESKLDDRVMLS
jgi:hypothetical protein